jgi:hypothetical protein
MTGDGVTEKELRAMVRESIARVAGARITTQLPRVRATEGGWTHASHLLLPLLRGGDGDGMCLIEPTVACNHCGYCLSFGH